jgi:hypothetical protein
MDVAVSGRQTHYCFSPRLIQDAVEDLLGVPDLGGLEVEDYCGVVPLQSKHLTH